MDQLVVIVVVGVLALAKWLLENAGKPKNGESSDIPDRPQQARSVGPRPVRPNAGSLGQEESEEAKMRRFMEALGLPKDAVPPPARKQVVELPAPKPDIRHVGHPISPSMPVRRPKISKPLDTGGPLPVLPKTASVAETAPSMELTALPQMTFADPAEAELSTRAEALDIKEASRLPGKKRQMVPYAQGALRELLGDPASLRRAILLREILGTPKGLHSTQTPSIFSPL